MMLDRNRKTKRAPQNFQEYLSRVFATSDVDSDEYIGRFDVIITCEERVFDQTCESNYIPTHKYEYIYIYIYIR